MRLPLQTWRALVLLPVGVLTLASPAAWAAERITLSTGFDLVCDHRVTEGGKTRLYQDAAETNYVEVPTAQIAAAETVALGVPPPAQLPGTDQSATMQQTGHGRIKGAAEVLTPGALHQVLAAAGQAHDLDVDLLASVVHAESNGRVHARSRVGAEGLMQLMPATAAELGVADAYAPEANVGGGAAYLGGLLTRYHDNLALALAAYNAGPAAVDRWHGVPPYRETRAYVARIIHEFNQRFVARQAALLAAAVAPPLKH